MRRDTDDSPRVTEDPDEAQFWRKTGVGVIELQPALTYDERAVIAIAADELCDVSSAGARYAATLRYLLERTK